MPDYIRIDNRPTALPTITLSQSQFEELPEYSMSYPTGTTYGKKWKRKVKTADGNGFEWWMGEYYDIGKEDKVGMKWRTIQILEAT